MRSLLVGLFLVSSASGAATLCAANEKVVFSCAVARSKIVSVCRAPGAGQGPGSLAYRFGRPGRPELVFPSSTVASFSHFRFAHYFRSQVDRTELNFTIAAAEYTVYDDVDGEAKPASTRGVRVTTGGSEFDLPCVEPAVSRMQALEALVPCDADNALGGCREKRSGRGGR